MRDIKDVREMQLHSKSNSTSTRLQGDKNLKKSTAFAAPIFIFISFFYAKVEKSKKKEKLFKNLIDWRKSD